MSSIFYVSTLKSSLFSLREFTQYLVTPIFLILIFILTAIKAKLKVTTLLKGISLFLIGIMPFIFLPRHISPVYLSIASTGILYIFVSSLEKIKANNTVLVAISILWLISSYLTLSFTRSNHWIVNEQALSKSYVGYTQSTIPKTSPKDIFLFRPPDDSFSKQNNFSLVEVEDNIRQSLNNHDAVRVIYDDSSLRSFFAHPLETIKLPQDGEVHEISPRGD